MRWIILLLCFISQAWGASLQWNASIPDAEHGPADGYRVYYGTDQYQLNTVYDTGLYTSLVIPDDWPPGTYYFGVKAYNENGESGWATTSTGQTWTSFDIAEPPVYTGAINLRASKIQKSGGTMGSAYIGNTQGRSASTTNLTTETGTDLNVASGDLLVAWAKWEDAARTPTLVDEGSTNTFTRSTIANYLGNVYGCFFYCLTANADSTARFTLQMGSATAYVSITVLQFRPDSGETYSLSPSSGNPVLNTGHGSSPATTAIDPSGSDIVTVAGLSEYTVWAHNASNPRIGDTNTGVSNISNDGSTTYTNVWYKLHTTELGSIDADSSMNASGDYVIGLISFASEASGASAVPANRGNVGMMLGMSSAMWLDNDFLKPTGGN